MIVPEGRQRAFYRARSEEAKCRQGSKRVDGSLDPRQFATSKDKNEYVWEMYSRIGRCKGASTFGKCTSERSEVKDRFCRTIIIRAYGDNTKMRIYAETPSVLGT